jgi:hypothetical protein
MPFNFRRFLSFAILAILLGCFEPLSQAQQVLQVRWPSKNTAPPVSFRDIDPQFVGPVRMGLAMMSEESLISAALAQGDSFGLRASDSKKLDTLFSNYYSRLRQNPAFKKAPSALTYCASERKQSEGLATVYVPAKITRDTQTILFLHGEGGSLLAYLYFLSTTYPNDIIVCPAYGITPSKVPLAYVLEAENAVANRLKIQLNKPLLIGLADGGSSACRLYTQKPDAARGVICLGNFAPAECLKQLNKSLSMHFLVGAKEPYAGSNAFKHQMLAIKSRIKTFDWQTIPNADEFFLLTHESEARKILLRWEPR